MRSNLEHAEAIASALNAKLRPFAERPVDINDPKWMQKLHQSSPLDEAGVRDQAEALLQSLLAAHVSGTSNERGTIREIFRNNRAFAWATGLHQPPDTADGFRQRVLHLSVLAHAEDPRDINGRSNRFFLRSRRSPIRSSERFCRARANSQA